MGTGRWREPGQEGGAGAGASGRSQREGFAEEINARGRRGPSQEPPTPATRGGGRGVAGGGVPAVNDHRASADTSHAGHVFGILTAACSDPEYDPPFAGPGT